MVELVELPIPDRVGGEGWDDFAAGIAIRSHVESIAFRTDDLRLEPEDEWPHYRDPDSPQRMILARDERGFVGRARYETTAGGDTAWLNVEVPPAYRHEGIGTALADAVEQRARDAGLLKAIAYVPIAEHPGPRLPAPTGSGSVPAESPDVRFLLDRGYRLEQVERASRLPLPVPGLVERVADAERRIAPTYRLHTWQGSHPDRWTDDIALLTTRMSIDVPTAGLDEPEDVWTADRVRSADARLSDDPALRLVAAAEHRVSGRLAGFTVLSVPPRPTAPVAQWATLVRREHRGHGLGQALKLANLAQLEQVAPGHPCVTTYNAEENRHMLDVNEALGFVPLAYQSGWRKDL